LTLLKYYEALYGVAFTIKKEDVLLRDIVPTQSQTRKRQVETIVELLVPVSCVEYEGKFYILDGHARSLRAMQMGLNSIEAMILSPGTRIDFGIVKTAREMNLSNLRDIKIVE